MQHGFKKIVAILLLVIGVQLWFVVGHGMWGRNMSIWVIGGALVLAIVPPTWRWIAHSLDAIRNPSPLARRIATIAIALAATGYFILTARQQGVELFPRIHDESSYLIQTRMLLHGRLWEPEHPLADFFESFHILVKPVYASKYFSGAALLYAAGLALGLPYWLLPALAAGATVGLVYRVISELTDGVGGALAALMMIGSSSLRRVSVLYIATTPLMLLALASLWAYLHWRRDRRSLWAGLMGFFMSWALITRPLDAICFAIPIGIAMLMDLRGSSLRSSLVHLSTIVLAALPLLALQIICNVGITGRWNQTAWTAYTRDDDPFDGLAIGALDSTLKSKSSLPQKIEFSEGFTKGAATERRAPGRVARFFKDELPADVNVMLPHPLLIMLVPVGLLALSGKARAVLYTTLPLCIIAYALYTFSVPQYLVIATPAAALAVVLGIEALAIILPRFRQHLWALLSLAVVGLVATQLPQLNRYMLDDYFRPIEPKGIALALSNIDRKPAVVLFHYRPGLDNPHLEPVYNTDVAWPDDAPVIRAHDLGARNVEIFRYYPERAFYVCNPRFSAPRYLGTGRDLAARATTAPSGL